LTQINVQLGLSRFIPPVLSFMDSHSGCEASAGQANSDGPQLKRQSFSPVPIRPAGMPARADDLADVLNRVAIQQVASQIANEPWEWTPLDAASRTPRELRGILDQRPDSTPGQ
jgi:hypothetical protein